MLFETSKKPTKSAKSSALLSLPGEIRNLIYEFCFLKPTKGIDLRLVRHRSSKREDLKRALAKKVEEALGKRQNQLSLLQTCKQVYNEAKYLVWYDIGATLFELHGAWKNNPYELRQYIRGQHFQKGILNAFRDIGHHFEHVQRLEIVGFDTLALMLAPPQLPIGQKLTDLASASRWVPDLRRIRALTALRQDLNEVKNALHGFRRAVPHVKHLVMFDKCFDELARHHQPAPWLVMIASDPKCHWLLLKERFPLLDTLHLRSFDGRGVQEQYEYVKRGWRLKGSSKVLKEFSDPETLGIWLSIWREARHICPLLWV